MNDVKQNGDGVPAVIGSTAGMIDSHCHLEQKETFFRREQLISECRAAGMSALVTVCARPQDFELTLDIVRKHKGFIFATAGIHPLESVSASNSENEIDAYIELIKRHRSELNAIGEIGIDDILVKEPSKRQRSRDVFIQFVELADEIRLPIVIHCREAYPEVIKKLSDRGAKRVVFHYFNKPDLVGDIADQGWCVSLPVTLALSSAKRLSDLLKNAGDKMADVMVETDSPIELSDGKRITPMDVRLIVDAIAKQNREESRLAAAKAARTAKEFFRFQFNSDADQ